MWLWVGRGSDSVVICDDVCLCVRASNRGRMCVCDYLRYEQKYHFNTNRIHIKQNERVQYRCINILMDSVKLGNLSTTGTKVRQKQSLNYLFIRLSVSNRTDNKYFIRKIMRFHKSHMITCLFSLYSTQFPQTASLQKSLHHLRCLN